MSDSEGGPVDRAVTLDWLAARRPGFGRLPPESEFRYEGSDSGDYSVTETCTDQEW